MVPSRKVCLEIMEREGMPPHIRAHSEQVNRIALFIGRSLNECGGQLLDIKLIEAGALLHDIRKMESINEGGNHAVMGADFVASLGYGEVAPLVAKHVNIGEWHRDDPIDEALVINYADKRVMHDKIVSLKVRFDDLLDRYGKTRRSRERLLSLQEELFDHEAKIFRCLDFGPERIIEGF